MTAPIATKCKTATAAHTEPTVMANTAEFCCEDTVRLGLGTVELRQDGSNSPEPSILVQAKRMGVI